MAAGKKSDRGVNCLCSVPESQPGAAFAAAAAARLRPTKSAFRGASHSDHYCTQGGKYEQCISLAQHLRWDTGVGGYGIPSSWGKHPE